MRLIVPLFPGSGGATVGGSDAILQKKFFFLVEKKSIFVFVFSIECLNLHVTHTHSSISIQTYQN